MCSGFIMYASAYCENLHNTSTHINKNGDLSIHKNIYAKILRPEKLTFKGGRVGVFRLESVKYSLPGASTQPTTGSGSVIWDPMCEHVLCTPLSGRPETLLLLLGHQVRACFSISCRGCHCKDAQGKGFLPSLQPD